MVVEWKCDGTSMTYNKNFIITRENFGNSLCHIKQGSFGTLPS